MHLVPRECDRLCGRRPRQRPRPPRAGQARATGTPPGGAERSSHTGLPVPTTFPFGSRTVTRKNVSVEVSTVTVVRPLVKLEGLSDWAIQVPGSEAPA